MAQEHDEQQSAGYPLGRGYGHDYMRGGEVFGGYGYSQRGAYETPRGDHPDCNEPPPDGQSIDAAAAELSAEPVSADGIGEQLGKLEHTFGSSGGNVRHSRSYYVTQAQLQQRVYKTSDTDHHSAPPLGADHANPAGHELS